MKEKITIAPATLASKLENTLSERYDCLKARRFRFCCCSRCRIKRESCSRFSWSSLGLSLRVGVKAKAERAQIQGADIGVPDIKDEKESHTKVGEKIHYRPKVTRVRFAATSSSCASACRLYVFRFLFSFFFNTRCRCILFRFAK